MIDLNQLKKIKNLEVELTITFEDQKTISKETAQLMQCSPNVFVTFPSDYAFDCVCCEEVMPSNNPYRILKEDNPKIIMPDKVLPIKSLESEPEFDSKLNYVPLVGYVCDHCRDSVYEEVA